MASVGKFVEPNFHDLALADHPLQASSRLARNDPNSVHWPDLHAPGAVDGRPLGGLPQDNDDALARRDIGLEVLDVTAQAQIGVEAGRTPGGRRQEDEVVITSNSTAVIDSRLPLDKASLERGRARGRRGGRIERRQAAPAPAARRRAPGRSL